MRNDWQLDVVRRSHNPGLHAKVDVSILAFSVAMITEHTCPVPNHVSDWYCPLKKFQCVSKLYSLHFIKLSMNYFMWCLYVAYRATTIYL